MTLDLPTILVVIGVSGYCSFRTFTYFTNSQFNAVNGEKLVFKSLLYGSINLILFLFFLGIFSIKIPQNVEDNFFKISLMIFSLIFMSAIVGLILASSYKTFVENNKKLLSELIVNDNPVYSNYLEEHLIFLFNPINKENQNSKTKTLSYFEMKNGKIYIGLIQKFDLNDDMPINERFIKLVPIYSGRRSSDDKVTLPTDYLKVAVDNFIKNIDMEAGVDNDFKVKILNNAIMSIKPITFSQSDILTLREFDEEMARGFNLI
jgi:hypothetical protein